MTSKAQRLRQRKARTWSRRKDGIDHPVTRHGGQARETAEEIRSVAVTARLRHGLASSKKEATDPRAGYVLGRLWMCGDICQHQHDAGRRFAADWGRYMAAIGAPRPWPKSASLDGEGRGARDIDEETTARWRAAFSNAIGAARSLSHRHYVALTEVAINEDEPSDLNTASGVLRDMVRFYGIDCDGEGCRETKKVNTK